MNVEEKTQLSEITTILEETNQWIQNILDVTGWSEDFLKTKNFEADISKKLKKSCDKALMNYKFKPSEEDIPLSSAYFYEGLKNIISLKLDVETCSKIVGSENINEVRELLNEGKLSELEPSLRLKLYDYCIDVAKESGKQIRLLDEQLMLLDDKKQSENLPKTEIEIRAAMRDMKRRRQSYKGKNVHTASKSYTEVLHDVLLSQMEILRQQFIEETNRKHSKHSKDRDSKKEEIKDRKKRRGSTHSDEQTVRKKHKKHRHESHKKSSKEASNNVSQSDLTSESFDKEMSDKWCTCQNNTIRNQLELKICPVHDSSNSDLLPNEYISNSKVEKYK